MSRWGNCWDNAVAESFLNSLKRELISGVNNCYGVTPAPSTAQNTYHRVYSRCAHNFRYYEGRGSPKLQSTASYPKVYRYLAGYLGAFLL